MINICIDPATDLPVDVAKIKLQARIDVDIEDSLLDGYIRAAVDLVEHETGRGLMPQKWLLKRDSLLGDIDLPSFPVLSVTSIKYLDSSAVEQIVDAAHYKLVQTSAHQFSIKLLSGFNWPQVLSEVDAVSIEYEVGYESSDDVPASIKQWITLVVAYWYKNREAGGDVQQFSIPRGFYGALLDPHRLWR